MDEKVASLHLFCVLFMMGRCSEKRTRDHGTALTTVESFIFGEQIVADVDVKIITQSDRSLREKKLA